MNRWWVPAAVFAVLVVAGCSKDESPTQPSQPKNYMPLAVGNWWVYSRVELDTNGREKSGTEWRDSVVVVGTVRKAGKTAYALVSHYQGWPVETTYVAREGNKLYVYVVADIEDNPLATFGPWVPMVDFSWQSWGLQDSLRLEGVKLDGFEGSFVGVARLNGQRVGSEQVLIRERNQTVQAEKFQLKLSIDGNFEAQGIRIPLRFEMTMAMWFAENIGRVADRTEPGVLRIQPPPPLPPQQEKTEGEAGVLLNYQVQQ